MFWQSKRFIVMKPWEERPIEIAHLLNPAFCGELLRVSIKAHYTSTKVLFPFPLAFLVLPIVLHRKTREAILPTTKEQMHAWLQSRPEIRVGFAERAKDLVPITREAIAFLLQVQAIAMDDRGNLRVTPHTLRTVPTNQEIQDCYRKAEILGRWFARTGTPSVIYTMWGVKP